MTAEFDAVIAEATALISDPQLVVRAVLSGVVKGQNPPAVRMDLKPVLIKRETLLQVVSNDGRLATTKNYPFGTLDMTELLTSGFANILVEHLDGALNVKISKPGVLKVTRETAKRAQNLSHDRSKDRLLSADDPFLIAVGISDTQGVVKPSRMDKYKQVEEFLRILNPTLTAAISAGQITKPTSSKPLEIVDLGCGNAYLTFATHQFLRGSGLSVNVVGVDVRPDSRDRNIATAQSLGIQDSISFRAETISATSVTSVDVAIALHACDTATDDAIAWAVKADAKLLLIAPCCHHDIQKQLADSPEPWSMLTRYGVMQERLADLITDTFRAQLLRMVGYRVEIIEFVGGEHTPRNLMIRAVKTGAAIEQSEIAKYEELKRLWQVTPKLELLLL